MIRSISVGLLSILLISCTSTFADDEATLARLVAEADIIVVGVAISGSPGDPRDIYTVLKEADFNALVPRYAMPIVTIRVTDTLKGQSPQKGNLSFYRLSELTLATENIMKHDGAYLGKKGVWILRETSNRKRSKRPGKRVPVTLWADNSSAYQEESKVPFVRSLLSRSKEAGITAPASHAKDVQKKEDDLSQLIQTRGLEAIRILRDKLPNASPDQKREIIWLFNKYGIIPMIPDIIDLITDPEMIPSKGDMIYGTVGRNAASMLGRYASLLDGKGERERGRERFTFSGVYGSGEKFDVRAAEVQKNWSEWWKDYKKNGPK